MSKLLNPEDVKNYVSARVCRNELWKNKNLKLFYIINPTAGCFNKKSKALYYKKVILEDLKKIKDVQVVVNKVEELFYVTEYAGHAKKLVETIVTEIANEDDSEKEYLIVSGGGDGTSLEVQTTLYLIAQNDEKKFEKIKNQITVLRLPLGTGNDGTDGHSLEETIDLFDSALEFKNVPAVKVYPEKVPVENAIEKNGLDAKKYNPDNPQYPWYAFNIASIGLDAFVVYMTNTVKRKLPGNFYHLCVPLSGFVYDKKPFISGNAKIEFFDENHIKFNEVEKKLTIFAFGASGHRRYGGGHKILPTDENVCYAPKVTITKLLEVNSKLMDGSFVGTGVAFLNSAKKVRISYDKPILLQCDGEVALLCKEYFPLIFELTDPCLRIIQKQ